MTRLRAHLVLAVLAVLFAACTVVEWETLSLDGCTDLTVGGSTILETPRDFIPGDEEGQTYEWTLDGPGELDLSVTSVPLGGAKYTATEPGTARVALDVLWIIGRAAGLPSSSIKIHDTCVIEVREADATSQPTSSTTTEPPTDAYEVVSTVTVSNVEGVAPVGLEASAMWRFSLPCDDGRCDGELIDGGPWGDFEPFPLTYRDELADYTFEYLRPLLENHPCDEDRWTGEILPTEWGPDGPVAFTFFMVENMLCDTGDVVVEWEGTGRRG